MKLIVKPILLIFIGINAFAMEMPEKKRKEPEEETLEFEELPEASEERPSKAFKIGSEQQAQELKAKKQEPELSAFEILPNEVKRQILEYLITPRGATNTAKLYNAAEFIRRFMTLSTAFQPFLHDEKVAGYLIKELAKRYANNNYAKAALALGTQAANQWLKETILAKATAEGYIPVEIWDIYRNTEYYAAIALKEAIANNDMGEINFLLAAMPKQMYAPTHGSSLISEWWQGNTPLMMAIQANLPFLAEKLIAAGTDLNYKNLKGENALQLALMKGQLPNDQLPEEIALRLIDAGINLFEYSEPLLIIAAKSFKPQVVKRLIDKGLNVNIVNRQGISPLHAAIAEFYYGLDEPEYKEKQKLMKTIVQILIDAGANVNFINPMTRESTLMHAAVDNIDPEVVAMLLRAGANIYAKDKDGKTALEKVRKDYKEYKDDEDEEVPLREEIIKMLEDAEAKDIMERPGKLIRAHGV